MKPYPRPTYQIAMAAGRDAANRSAARAGRSSWNEDDRAAAQAVFNGLYRLADTGDADLVAACGSSPRD
jgi:hypothetical protein